MTSSLLAATALRPQSASAVEFRLTGGAVEESDDRFRPVAGIEFLAASGLLGAAMIYGRRFGPVTEQTVILSGGRPFDLFGGNAWQGVLGISVLLEKTTIEGSTAADPENLDANLDASSSFVQESTNIGAVFGVRCRFFQWRSFAIAGAWESHLYPPGLNVVYLATGRKQLLTLNAGVTL